MNKISYNIKKYRLKANKTQSSLAKKIGVTSNYIANIEQSVKTPSLDILEKIAEQLNIPSKLLLEELPSNIKIDDYGDPLEQHYIKAVREYFPEYEKFWADFIFFGLNSKSPGIPKDPSFTSKLEELERTNFKKNHAFFYQRYYTIFCYFSFMIHSLNEVKLYEASDPNNFKNTVFIIKQRKCFIDFLGYYYSLIEILEDLLLNSEIIKKHKKIPNDINRWIEKKKSQSDPLRNIRGYNAHEFISACDIDKENSKTYIYISPEELSEYETWFEYENKKKGEKLKMLDLFQNTLFEIGQILNASTKKIFRPAFEDYFKSYEPDFKNTESVFNKIDDHLVEASGTAPFRNYFRDIPSNSVFTLSGSTLPIFDDF